MGEAVGISDCLCAVLNRSDGRSQESRPSALGERTRPDLKRYADLILGKFNWQIGAAGSIAATAAADSGVSGAKSDPAISSGAQTLLTDPCQ